MKYLIMLSLLAMGCSAPNKVQKPNKVINTSFAKEIKFDKDQVIVCAYNNENSLLYCMTPEEYNVRVSVEANP